MLEYERIDLSEGIDVNNILYVQGNAYRIHFWYMSRDDAINIMNNSNLADKRGVL